MKTRVLVVDDSPTVRRVVAGILERRGFEAILAEDGRHALDLLTSGTKVDLALVDFVMPRMNGYQFCRALREDPALAATPVVLMSAKSDRIREQFVERAHALDAISKPFDGRALLAMVEHALERVREGRVPAASVPSLPAPDPDEAPGTLTSEPPPVNAVLLAGDVRFVPVGALLQLLQMEQKTCTLYVMEGDRRITMAMRDGLVDRVFGESAGEEFRLGRFLIELGAATPADIEEALVTVDERRSRGAPSRLGDVLLEEGRVQAEQLREALVRQSSELAYEAVRWQKGRFEVRPGEPPELAKGPRLALPVAHLIMEGVRRVDEWRVLESMLGSFDTVLARDTLAIVALGDHELSRPEHLVLDAIDGRRTVRQVVDACHMSSFDTCKILCQLIEARLVRSRGASPNAASPMPASGTGSREMS